MQTPPNRGIYPAGLSITVKLSNAVPKTAEAEQQFRTPCNATRQVVKLTKRKSLTQTVFVHQNLPRLWLRPILETGALMSRLSFVPSSICFIGVP